MSKSKKVFLIVAIVFFVVIVYLGYDISSRTTFPGSKPQLKERLMNSGSDESNSDSTKFITPQDSI
ncbi:hypothetical protein [Fulvivirga ligni]|uniref:hypothetical protein n=1 Tax=Fulvivirga ligni TaxID=2904246 RepID=UPI001F3C534F|nr:hypothetical protein [Fulvivirga ligni]UII24311.1 hypothetical protein LVD16_13900 [Fulvivirga ligni]